MEVKNYLYRDDGYILFNSHFKNREYYWMSFLSGGHVDWSYYIEIKKPEFFSIWEGSNTISDIYKNYSDIRMSAPDSKKFENKFKLRNAIELHDLPPATEQMYFKSVIPNES